MADVSGEFEVAGWDEQPYDEPGDGSKLAKATITQKWTGAADGTASIVMLHALRKDGTARFVGLQRFEGTLDDRSGTFLMESRGDYADDVARGELTIVERSGTGELAGITGTGSWQAPKGPHGTYTLSYDIG
jgi:hypothetical protein